MLVEYDSSWQGGYKPVFAVKRSSGNANVPEFCRMARGDGKMYQPSSVVEYNNRYPQQESALACFMMATPSVPPIYNKGSLQNAHLHPIGQWTYFFPTYIPGAKLEFADSAYAPYVSWSNYTGTSDSRDNAFLHIKYHESGPTVKACNTMRVSWVVATNCIEKISASIMYIRAYNGEYRNDGVPTQGTTKNVWRVAQKDLHATYLGYPLYIVTGCRDADRSVLDFVLWNKGSDYPLYLSSNRPDADIFFGFGAAGGFSQNDYFAVYSVMYEWGRFYYNGQS